MEERVRISVCGVMEYACQGGCGDWIREHEAVWLKDDGVVAPAGGSPYCPACHADVKDARKAPEAA